MRVLLLSILAACTAACAGDVAGNVTDGAQVFATTCAMCHGSEGKPNEAMVAQLGVADLTAPAERAKITSTFVEHQVRAGSKNKLMPSFAGALRDDQIRAVAAYVASPQFPKH